MSKLTDIKYRIDQLDGGVRSRICVMHICRTEAMVQDIHWAWIQAQTKQPQYPVFGIIFGVISLCQIIQLIKLFEMLQCNNFHNASIPDRMGSSGSCLGRLPALNWTIPRLLWRSKSWTEVRRGISLVRCMHGGRFWFEADLWCLGIFLLSLGVITPETAPYLPAGFFGGIIIEHLGVKVVVQLEDIDHNRLHLYVRVFRAVLKLFVETNIVVNFWTSIFRLGNNQALLAKVMPMLMLASKYYTWYNW